MNFEKLLDLNWQVFKNPQFQSVLIIFKFVHLGLLLSLLCYLKLLLFIFFWAIIFQLLLYRVRTLFWTKTSRTLQGLSRTHFAFFKDSIQCKKEIWVYVFFSSTTTWAILSWRSFILGTWESGLDKVSTEIQGLSSTDYNLQGLSRPWTFYFKFQGLSRTFKDFQGACEPWL